ncbi:MAG: tetratricopeptide repeat protein [Deltaproteobacteria bacterium]|jgi:tetratricopeptide (TPR) repeat protein|nr:tetratricopeptide repeat protein [Deltaproteobacteria bacterium]
MSETPIDEPIAESTNESSPEPETIAPLNASIDAPIDASQEAQASQDQASQTPTSQDQASQDQTSQAQTSQAQTTQAPLSQEEQLALVEAQLKAILNQDPNNQVALNQLGVLAVRRQDFDLAITAFSRVIALSPDNQMTRKNLVLALLTKGQPDQAIGHLENLLSKNQNDFQLWSLLSQAQKSVGQLLAAQESAQKSLLINPNQPPLKAWLDSQAPKPRVKPEPPKPSPTKPRVNQLTFLCSQGQDEEIDLLGAYLDQSMTVKKVLSLGEEPYLAALSGRGALWLEGVNPRSVMWLSRLAPSSRPVVLRLGPKDLAGDVASLNLSSVTSIIAETKAIMDFFLAKGAKPQGGSKLAVVPRLVPASRIAAQKKAPAPNLSVAYLGDWDEPGLVLETLIIAKRQDPQATLWAMERPKNPAVARFIDQAIAKNNLAGSVLFATPSLSKAEFYAGRTHFLLDWLVAGGAEVFKALAYGLSPLARDSLGAAELLPSERLWSNLKDLERLLSEPGTFDPVAYVEKISDVTVLGERVLGLL